MIDPHESHGDVTLSLTQATADGGRLHQMECAEKDMLEAAAERVQAETWAHPAAQARYLRALENAAWSLYVVLAGTPSDRTQCAREWAEILLPRPARAARPPQQETVATAEATRRIAETVLNQPGSVQR